MDTNSTGWRLFNTFFTFRTKQMHLMSDNVVREWGIVTTTIPEYDTGLANSLTDFRANGPRVATMLGEGIGVFLKYPGRDAEQLYGLIQDHFEWYSRKIRSAVLFNNEKLLRVQDDLKKLDLLNHSCWRLMRNKALGSEKPARAPLRGNYGLGALIANQLYTGNQSSEDFDRNFKPLSYYLEDEDFYRLIR